ncbi:MAG: YiiD C-terminal domain-containing protein [Longimicrobiales bacterium]|nr:YiiD C-terminal domain-containing protein [Longimicrobiales bacterium]
MHWDPEALRHRVNAYPPYSGALIEVTHISDDASEIRIRMPLEESNANLVGTHFGGSLYAMVDPHLMILLIQRLGSEYVVWDKAASIEFLRPGVGTVTSTIRVSSEEVDEIRAATADGSKYHPEWTLEVLDEEGDVIARVHKTLYVRRNASSPQTPRLPFSRLSDSSST